MIWNIQFRLEIEYEVEIVLKTNLKQFIKYVLKGNRRNIYNIYNGLNRTRRAAAVREFRPLTSNGHYGRSDLRILLKPEPLGSYRKEISNEF